MKKTKPDYECSIPTCKLIKIPDTKYCIYHQNLRGTAPPVKEVDKYNIQGFKNENEMFKYIWETRPHVCQITGDKLDEYFDTDYWYNCFAHILPKRENAFPEFRLYINNVFLVIPDIHMLYDQGTLKQILEWEKNSGKSMEVMFELERVLTNEYSKNIKRRKTRNLNQQYFETKNK